MRNLLQIIPSTTALVHSMQSHATEQRQLKKQVKKMSKIALKKGNCSTFDMIASHRPYFIFWLNQVYKLFIRSLAAKKHYIDRTSTVMQDKSETMIKKSFPRVTVKRYAPFNKVITFPLTVFFSIWLFPTHLRKYSQEEYVQQAMDRAKSKVLRPQDVQEYYNNLRQFRTH